jgi:hypothetical protein
MLDIEALLLRDPFLFLMVPFYSLSTPVKMRGKSSTPRIYPTTFIVMDRLYGTVDDKIEEWAVTKKENKGNWMGMGANDSVLKELLKDRLLVAYDITSAFQYMHDLK